MEVVHMHSFGLMERGIFYYEVSELKQVYLLLEGTE